MGNNFYPDVSRPATIFSTPSGRQVLVDIHHTSHNRAATSATAAEAARLDTIPRPDTIPPQLLSLSWFTDCRQVCCLPSIEIAPQEREQLFYLGMEAEERV